MSGGTTGLAIPERALANMLVLVATWEGGPLTDIYLKLYTVPGSPPPDDAGYLRQQCQDVAVPQGQYDSSEEWYDTPPEWSDPQEAEDFACYTGYN